MFSVRPFFPGPARRQRWLLLKFADAPPNGFLVAIEKLRQINQAATAQLEDFGTSIETAFSFAQGLEKATHGLFG